MTESREVPPSPARFAACLYLPGSAQAETVELEWSEGGLELIRQGGAPERIDFSTLRPDYSGFNLAMLTLFWPCAGGEAHLVLDATAARQFAAAAPAAFHQRLGAAHRQPRRLEHRWRLTWAFLATVLALPALLLVLFLIYADHIAGWAADRLPPQVEEELGQAVLAQTRAKETLLDTGPAVEALRRIGKRLLPAGTEYQWYVADNPEVNAFAAPGGIVVVNRGLLQQAESADELAGVLAHEIAHVELHHGTRGMVKSLGLRVAMTLALGGDADAAKWAGRLTELKFSRDAERAADARGLQMLLAADISPTGMLRFYARMAAAQESPAALAWLSTHPASGERLEALRETLQSLPPVRSRPLGIDWDAVRASLAPPPAPAAAVPQPRTPAKVPARH